MEVICDILITCDICPGDVPMDCIKTIKPEQSGKSWRQRWFKCPVCDYEKKINGSGYHSEIEVPLIINRKLKKQL